VLAKAASTWCNVAHEMRRQRQGQEEKKGDKPDTGGPRGAGDVTIGTGGRRASPRAVAQQSCKDGCRCWNLVVMEVMGARWSAYAGWEMLMAWLSQHSPSLTTASNVFCGAAQFGCCCCC
jgi:hypothetical protein